MDGPHQAGDSPLSGASCGSGASDSASCTRSSSSRRVINPIIRPSSSTGTWFSRFWLTIVSTSSGATISVLYTALHPEKVEALALSTLPLKAPPPTRLSPLVMGMTWLHENVVPNYYPRWYYRNSLSELYGRKENLRDQTVDWYYETNNIPGGFARVRQYYQANLKAVWAKGAGEQAAKVRVPILLQWGERDPVIPNDRADEAVKQFANAPVTLIRYPDAGHYPMLEMPQVTGKDLLAFLDKVYSAKAPAGAAQ